MGGDQDGGGEMTQEGVVNRGDDCKYDEGHGVEGNIGEAACCTTNAFVSGMGQSVGGPISVQVGLSNV